jgi:hypothetical protein
MTRRIALLLLVVEETDDSEPPPTLPPFPVVETTGETVPDSARPLAKTAPSNVVPLRKAVA